MSTHSKTLASLVSAALLAGTFGVTAAQADVSPFSAVSVGNAVKIAGMEGACGEGKCGSSESQDGMESEGKCGEGKCGSEGTCGEGKCGSE